MQNNIAITPLHHFKLGDIVRYSEEYLNCHHGGSFQPDAYFTVVGFSKEPQLVRIQKAGSNKIQTFHHSFLIKFR